MKVFLLLLSLTFVTFISCKKGEPIENTTDKGLTLNDFQNPLIQKVYEIAAKQSPEKLIALFDSGESKVHQLICKILSEIPGKNNPIIAQKLIQQYPSMDEKSQLYIIQALSKFGDTTSIDFLIKEFTRDSFHHAHKKAILSTVGNIADSTLLNLISEEKSYQLSDSLITEGQTYCLLNFQKRGYSSASSVKKICEIALSDKTTLKARSLAFQYLYRVKGTEYTFAHKDIIQVYNNSKNWLLYSHITPLLVANNGIENSLYALKQKLKTKQPKSSQIQILKSLSTYPTADVYDIIFQYAVDSSGHELTYPMTAFFEGHQLPEKAAQLLQIAELHQDTLSKFGLLKMSYQGSEIVRDYTTQNLFNISKTVKNPVYKSMVLDAFIGYPYNMTYIYNTVKSANEKIVTKKGTEILTNMLSDSKFEAYLLANPTAKSSIMYSIRENILSGDEMSTELAYNALKDTTEGWRTILGNNLSFIPIGLQSAAISKKDKVYSLLKELTELYKIPTDSIASYTPKSPELLTVDWKAFERMPSKVRLITNKGSILVEIDKLNAPLSAYRFLKNVGDKKYDNTFIHHESLGNLIQMGCARGDGYSYTQKYTPLENSVFNYQAAGKIAFPIDNWGYGTDQFLITTAPAISLENKYAAFGSVITGMQYIDKIHIGDKIIRIEYVSE